MIFFRNRRLVVAAVEDGERPHALLQRHPDRASVPLVPIAKEKTVRLTRFSDYALRILIYSAAHPETRVTIETAADYFQISRSHVKKVVLTLSHAGFLHSMKGRLGGFELARPAEAINLGAVIRATEPDFGLFECFLTGNKCRISCPCCVPTIANDALHAFLAVFDRHSLADARIKPEYFLTGSAQKTQPIRGPLQS